MNFLKTTVTAALICFSASLASAATIPIVNGSFENPLVGGNFNTYFGPNNTVSLPGWTINGSIDQIGNYWQASDGRQSLDMNGSGAAGTISQSITLPGGFTQVHFDMAGNTDGGPNTKTLEVSLLTGGGSQTFTFNITGHQIPNNMGWVSDTATFNNLAAGVYTLQFRSLDSGSYGAALDNVSVTVPDGGSTLTLLGLGILGLIGVRRCMPRFAIQ